MKKQYKAYYVEWTQQGSYHMDIRYSITEVITKLNDLHKDGVDPKAIIVSGRPQEGGKLDRVYGEGK